jgi:hypothetical protein
MGHEDQGPVYERRVVDHIRLDDPGVNGDTGDVWVAAGNLLGIDDVG